MHNTNTNSNRCRNSRKYRKNMLTFRFCGGGILEANAVANRRATAQRIERMSSMADYPDWVEDRFGTSQIGRRSVGATMTGTIIVTTAATTKPET